MQMKGNNTPPPSLYYNRSRLLAEISVEVSASHENNEASNSRTPYSEGFKQFTDFPLDIIFEMASYLEPTDLLVLVRMNKLFRSVFLSRSSLAVWRRCLSDTPHLPSCPSFLNEPQFASLIFDTYCMICCSDGRVTLDLGLCLRLCESCQKEYIITGRKLIKLYNRSIRAIFSLIPRSIPFNSRALPNSRVSSLENSDLHRYLLPEVELIIKLYNQQRESVEDSVAFQQQQAKATSIILFSNQVLQFKTMYREQFQARTELFTQRALQIKIKLIELGYEERYFPHSLEQWDIQKPKKLITDEDWPSLLCHLDRRYQGEKKGRLQTALNANLEARYNQFQDSLSPADQEAMPDWTVVKGLPSILKAIGSVDEFPDPGDHFWTTVFTHVLEEIQPYKEKTKSILHSVAVCSGFPGQRDDSSQNILQLALTLFDCKCWNLPKVVGLRPLHYYPEILRCHPERFFSQNTLPSHVLVIPELRKCAESILLALNLPLNTISVVVRGHKFVCGCGHPDHCQPLDFPLLVRHIYNEQLWYNDRKMRIRPIMRPEAPTLFINDHDTSCLPDLLKSSSNSSIITSQPSTSTMNVPQSSFCSYCYRLLHLHERFDNLSQAQHHMRTKHGVQFEPAHLMDKSSLHSMYGRQLRSDAAYERALITPRR